MNKLTNLTLIIFVGVLFAQGALAYPYLKIMGSAGEGETDSPISPIQVSNNTVTQVVPESVDMQKEATSVVASQDSQDSQEDTAKIKQLQAEIESLMQQIIALEKQLILKLQK
jgi:hypothetical protein